MKHWSFVNSVTPTIVGGTSFAMRAFGWVEYDV